MFQLRDIRDRRVWPEAHALGVQKGFAEGFKEGFRIGYEEGKTTGRQELVRKCLATGMSAKEIAELLEIPVSTVRRLAKNGAKH